MRTMGRAGGVLAAALACAGCTALVDGDLGGLEPNPNQKQRVQVTLRDFTAHVDQDVEILIVEPEMDFIQARMIVDPVPEGGTFRIDLPRAAALNAQRVDFYADANENGRLDPPVAGGDHVWRETLDENGALVFVHSFEFFDIIANEPPREAALNDLSVRVTGAQAFRGPVHAALVAQDVVGASGTAEAISAFYFLGTFADGTVTFSIPAIVDGGRPYQLELGFDAGTRRCLSAPIQSPNNGAFSIELPISELDCTLPEREQPLFVDMGR